MIPLLAILLVITVAASSRKKTVENAQFQIASDVRAIVPIIGNAASTGNIYSVIITKPPYGPSDLIANVKAQIREGVPGRPDLTGRYAFVIDPSSSYNQTFVPLL